LSSFDPASSTTTTTTTSTTGVAQDTSGTTSGGTGEVPPPALPDGGICTPYLTTYIQYGYTNNTDDVTRLQNFLNSHEGESLSITGTYDEPSFEAVKRFQSKYASSVLTVWGLSSPTGYVYKTTRNKINSFNCNTTIICPEFVGDFVPGETDPEISKIKSLLNDLGFAAGSGEYYDDTMKSAVNSFQETFHKVILDPRGLTKGTAWIHNTTRKYLNDLVGCATGPADLDGKGSFEY
jgi:peptidoglycan hydrolase-like protein with peptidoglycan-binding domain